MKTFIHLLNLALAANFYKRYQIPGFLKNGIAKNMPNFNLPSEGERGSGEEPEVLENEMNKDSNRARSENSDLKVNCVSTRKGNQNMKRLIPKILYNKLCIGCVLAHIKSNG